MNFTNMSPADRMKASGLIGLIVVIIFFVVHTLLGAVAPKKPSAQTPDGAAPSPAAATAGPAVPPAGPTTQLPGQAPDFPTARAKATKESIARSLAMDPGDPFVQIEHPKDHIAAPAASKVADREIEMRPQPALPTFAPERGSAFGGSGLPSLSPNPGAPAGGTGILPVALPQPEIKVVGIVHGDRSVATLQVGSRMMIARPGDALFPGWRLASVSSEGVGIRHEGRIDQLRVGGVLNDRSERVEAKQ